MKSNATESLLHPDILVILPRESSILVGFSGGPDSLALLLILNELAPQYGWRVQAGHVDHGWRQESAEEANELGKLTHSLGIPFTSLRIEAPKDEDSARQARYKALNELANSLGASHLALGHTADDQLETIVFRLARGAALAGMGGIPLTRQQGNGPTIVRPLLHCTREQLIAYLEQHGQTWIEDPSNQNLAFRRNLIRHQVIPILKEINPHVAEVAAQNAEIIQSENRYLEELAEEKYLAIAENGALDLQSLLSLPLILKRRVIVHALSQLLGGHRRFTQAHVARILELLECGEGRQDVIEGVKAAIRYGKVWLYREEHEEIPFNRETPQELHGWRIEVAPSPPGPLIPRERGGDQVEFDAEALPPDLVWRRPLEGDRFQPWGHQGEHSLVHFLTRNRLVPWTQWVLASGGIIYWVVGIRRSTLAKVDQNTRQILSLQAFSTIASSV